MKKNTGVLTSFTSGDLDGLEPITQYIQTVVETVVTDSDIVDEYLNSKFDTREVVIEQLEEMLARISEMFTYGK